MSYGNRLFYHRGLYDTEGTDSLFASAIVENVRHHQTHCPEYAEILRKQGFSIDDIKSVDDLWKIPPFPHYF